MLDKDMNRFLLTLFSSIFAVGVCMGQEGYQLVWEEDFVSETPDSTLWSMVPAQPYDWARHMTSEHPELIEISDGTLKLRADYDRSTGTYGTHFPYGNLEARWRRERQRYVDRSRRVQHL